MNLLYKWLSLSCTLYLMFYLSPSYSSAEGICLDNVWCNIPMPLKSHYNLDPPNDLTRWKLAQNYSAINKQVLLKSISKVLTDSDDLLDGDINFRRYYQHIDIFMDSQSRIHEINHILRSRFSIKSLFTTSHKATRKLQTIDLNNEQTNSNKKTKKRTSKKKKGSNKINSTELLPPVPDFRSQRRAPVISLGYAVFGPSKQGTCQEVLIYFCNQTSSYNFIIVIIIT